MAARPVRAGQRYKAIACWRPCVAAAWQPAVAAVGGIGRPGGVLQPPTAWQPNRTPSGRTSPRRDLRVIPPLGHRRTVFWMADDPHADLESAEIPPSGDQPVAASEQVCPWCSAGLAGLRPDRCPACGARLTEDPDTSIPGVTTVDPASVRKAAVRSSVPKRRFLGLLVEDQSEPESGIQPSSAAALASPSPEVRREMALLRAELDAAASAEAGQIEAAEAAGAAQIAAEMRAARMAAEASTAPDQPAPPVP